MIEKITPEKLKGLIAQGGVQLIDVREFPEFSAGHVPTAQLLPLGEIERSVSKLDPQKPVYLICKSGKRATMAAEKLLACARDCQVCVVEGGTDAWVAAGFEVEKPSQASAVWSLERQVRFAAGSLVLLGFLIPPWPWLSLFVGAGLVFAAVTDTCAMGMLIAKLPWNRAPGSSNCCNNSCSK